jgi:ribosomal protein S18 acetylase RimI-like enzyme
MTFTIRSATLADVAQITRLHVDSWRNTYTFMPPEVHVNRSYAYRYEEWLEALSNPDPDQLILTVWNDELLVGFCSCRASDDPAIPHAKGELHAAYFRKEYRGHAIGVHLLDRMLRFLLKRNLWPACLWAFEENKVRHAYKAGGFIESVHRNRIIDGVSIPEVGYLTPDDPAALYVTMNRRLREEDAGSQMTPPDRPFPPASPTTRQTLR